MYLEGWGEQLHTLTTLLLAGTAPHGEVSPETTVLPEEESRGWHPAPQHCGSVHGSPRSGFTPLGSQGDCKAHALRIRWRRWRGFQYWVFGSHIYAEPIIVPACLWLCSSANQWCHMARELGRVHAGLRDRIKGVPPAPEPGQLFKMEELSYSPTSCDASPASPSQAWKNLGVVWVGHSQLHPGGRTDIAYLIPICFMPIKKKGWEHPENCYVIHQCLRPRGRWAELITPRARVVALVRPGAWGWVGFSQDHRQP